MRTSSTSTPSTRADKLRAERSQKTQQRINSAGLQVKNTPAPRPAVTVRGSRGTPVAKRAYSRPRRQYAFSVGTSGVEMLTPAIPVFNPGWRLLSAVLTVLSACLLTWVFPHGRTKLSGHVILRRLELRRKRCIRFIRRAARLERMRGYRIFKTPMACF